MDDRTAPASLSGKGILIIEDEAILAFELDTEIEAAGATFVEADPDVSHAIRTISDNEHFDAAILNVWLRGELSLGIADELRRRGIPFVFVTGSKRDILKQYVDITAHPKPADMEAVVRSLADLIARRGGWDQRRDIPLKRPGVGRALGLLATVGRDRVEHLLHVDPHLGAAMVPDATRPFVAHRTLSGDLGRTPKPFAEVSIR